MKSMNTAYCLDRSVVVVRGSDESWENNLAIPLYFIRDLPQDEGHERLLFHIQTGDYFSVINSVLGFCEEEVVSHFEDAEMAKGSSLLGAIRIVRKDLQYLHNHYQIVPKD